MERSTFEKRRDTFNVLATDALQAGGSADEDGSSSDGGDGNGWGEVTGAQNPARPRRRPVLLLDDWLRLGVHACLLYPLSPLSSIPYLYFMSGSICLLAIGHELLCAIRDHSSSTVNRVSGLWCPRCRMRCAHSSWRCCAAASQRPSPSRCDVQELAFRELLHAALGAEVQ